MTIECPMCLRVVEISESGAKKFETEKKLEHVDQESCYLCDEEKKEQSAAPLFLNKSTSNLPNHNKSDEALFDPKEDKKEDKFVLKSLEINIFPFQFWKDFFAFKINIFPFIVKILFALETLGCVLAGLYVMINNVFGNISISVMAGLGIAIVGPILLHISFELLLLLFSILDMLREIRNNIFEIRDAMKADKE